MIPYNIIKYSPENLPSNEVGAVIWELLERNYPNLDWPQSKRNSLEKRNTPEKIQDRIQKGVIYITIEDTQWKVLWFLEMKTVEVGQIWEELGGFYIELCWLIVDELHRRKWLASMLNKRFEQEARAIWETLEGKWCLQLATSKTNPAQEIYKKWWYKEYTRKGNDIWMVKDI